MRRCLKCHERKSDLDLVFVRIKGDEFEATVGICKSCYELIREEGLEYAL